MDPPRQARPAAPIVVSFLDCVNRGDVEGLGALMTEEHALCVFEEAPLVGRERNVAAWQSYASSFPVAGTSGGRQGQELAPARGHSRAAPHAGIGRGVIVRRSTAAGSRRLRRDRVPPGA
jgi:hypothetical protein